MIAQEVEYQDPVQIVKNITEDLSENLSRLPKRNSTLFYKVGLVLTQLCTDQNQIYV